MEGFWILSYTCALADSFLEEARCARMKQMQQRASQRSLLPSTVRSIESSEATVRLTPSFGHAQLAILLPTLYNEGLISAVNIHMSSGYQAAHMKQSMSSKK